MHVVLADVEAPAVEAAAAELRADGLSAVAVPADVSSLESVEALARRAVDAFGAVHLVCNNAGVGATHALAWEGSLAIWEWMIGVNLFGVVHGVRAFLPLLVAQGEGHIVNTASMAGLVAGTSGSTPYTATKYAVVGLSESLALELTMIGSPVRVSVLIPGPVETNLASAIRNWPSHLGPVPAPARADRAGLLPIPSQLRGSLETKMHPSAVAQLVLDGIRADRFWIVTHPAELAQLIGQRTKGLLSEVDGVQ
jgi:NAD(P)-dependent dehydrogenase (short-subunit alcohol dehydrogenase family)